MTQVKDRLQQLAIQRGGMMELWEDGWEHLQLSQSFCSISLFLCHQCFDTIGWAAGRASGL